MEGLKRMAMNQQQNITLYMTKTETPDDPASPVRWAVLTISTCKYYRGGLVSDATVYWMGGSSRQNTISLGSDDGDYDKRLRHTDTTVKATQKNIDQQHAEVFTPAILNGLIASARAHYAGRPDVHIPAMAEKVCDCCGAEEGKLHHQPLSTLSGTPRTERDLRIMRIGQHDGREMCQLCAEGHSALAVRKAKQ